MNFRSHWFAPLVIFGACLAGYLNSFTNHFLLDDFVVLFGQHGVLSKSFQDILLHDEIGFYRPLGHVPLWIYSRFLGHYFVGYHVVNFILFFFIVLLFFQIVQKLTRDTFLAFLSALLYALHPINGFIVNYITASIIAVFVILMQLSFLFFLRFSDNGKKNDYVISFIFFIGACFSHEMAMMLPAYLMAYLFYIKKDPWQKALKKLIPFIIFIAGWFVFRSQGAIFQQQLHNPLNAIGNAGAYFSTWMDLLNWYVSKLMVPQDIIFLCSAKFGVDYLFINVMTFIFVLGMAGYFFFKYREGLKSFWLMVFLLGFLPSLFACFIYFPRDWPLIEPHWFYFSEMGFFVLLGLLLQMMIQRNSRIGQWVLAGILIFYTFSCWEQNSKWKDQETYSRYWLSLNEGNWTPYYGLGHSLLEQGRYQEALGVLLQCYRHIGKFSVKIEADIGHCLDAMGQDKEALDMLKESILVDRGYALTYHYLGLYYAKRGQIELAQASFRKAVELDPKFSPSRGYLSKSKPRP